MPDPSWGIVVPFLFFLLCIAIAPFVAKERWEQHYHHVSFFLSAIVFLYYAIAFGADGLLRMLLSGLDYFSFMALVGSLYVIASGIYIEFSANHGTPLINVAVLAAGAVLANLIGTTGASMLLIRPFARLNATRGFKGYHVMFYIFLVGNVGGCLTPLGDPPLFLGYLQGVPFFWLLAQGKVVGAWLFVVGMLLSMFFVIDTWYYRKAISGSMHATFRPMNTDPDADDDEVEEAEPAPRNKAPRAERVAIDDDDDDIDNNAEDDGMLVPSGGAVASPSHGPKRAVQITGYQNFAFLFTIILLVLVQKAGFVQSVESTEAASQGIGFLISCFMMLTGFLAWRLSSTEALEANKFTFGPIKEVGLLFFGIFATMTPMLDILQQHATELHISSPLAFYWASGALSSVLDNAPTYLTFLAAAVGLEHGSLSNVADYLDSSSALYDPEFVKKVIAISLGSVFFGANTYIGNGPNFMIKALAEEGGAKCPSFLEYIYKYSGPILLPLFLIVSFMSVY